MMQIEVYGADVLLARLARLAAAPDRLQVEAEQTAQLLKTRIQGRASGRPGPRAPTGDYRRSWFVEGWQLSTGEVGFVVGTLKPQGPRLEYGFVGVDAIGRYYDQPPYPHVGPAVEEIRPGYIERVRRLLG